jgi:hypothetical protein
VRIDREEILKVDPALLPEDAQFKGYEEVTVQELIFRTDNVLRAQREVLLPVRAARLIGPRCRPAIKGNAAPN